MKRYHVISISVLVGFIIGLAVNKAHAESLVNVPVVMCGEHSLLLTTPDEAIIDGLTYVPDRESGYIGKDEMTQDYIYNGSRATITIKETEKNIYLRMDNEVDVSKCDLND